MTFSVSIESMNMLLVGRNFLNTDTPASKFTEVLAVAKEQFEPGTQYWVMLLGINHSHVIYLHHMQPDRRTARYIVREHLRQRLHPLWDVALSAGLVPEVRLASNERDWCLLVTLPQQT